MKAAFESMTMIALSDGASFNEDQSYEWAYLRTQCFNAARIPDEYFKYHLFVDGKDLGELGEVDAEALWDIALPDGDACLIPASRVRIMNGDKPAEWEFPALDREMKVKSFDCIRLLPMDTSAVCLATNNDPRGVILMDSGFISGGGLFYAREDRSFEALGHVCSISEGAYTLAKPTIGPQLSLHFTLAWGPQPNRDVKGVEANPAAYKPFEVVRNSSQDVLRKLKIFHKNHPEYTHLCFLLEAPMDGIIRPNRLSGFDRLVYHTAHYSSCFEVELLKGVAINGTDKIVVVDKDEKPIELPKAMCVTSGNYTYTPVGTIVLGMGENLYRMRLVTLIVIKFVGKRPLED